MIRRPSLNEKGKCLDCPAREVVPHDECRDQQRLRVGASVASTGDTCAFRGGCAVRNRSGVLASSDEREFGGDHVRGSKATARAGLTPSLPTPLRVRAREWR